MNHLDSKGHQVVWDATSLSSAQTCPRKFYYQHVKHWQPKADSIHLVFGGLFARAVEEFFLTATKPDFDYEKTLETIVRGALVDSFDHPSFVGESTKTRTNLIRAIVDYLDTYFKIDFPRLHWEDGVPSVEKNFKLDLEDGLVLTGRIDRVLEDDFGIQIVDQKTTKGVPRADYFKLYTPNTQVSCYLFAGRTIFSKPVRTFIIDAVGITKTGASFARGIISRTQSQLDEWIDGVRSLIRQIHTYEPAVEKSFPQNPAACGYFSGCQFREVCSASPEARKTLLEQNFERVPWDPIKGKRKETKNA